MMTIGIIETGRPKDEVIAVHGDFPKMFRTYFGETSDAEFITYSVATGMALPGLKACDAWIITGSLAGVYEDHDWIPPLMDFVRAAFAASVPMLGVCFGHQLMAQALGGTVTKSKKGRGIGVHQYTVTEAGRKIIPQLNKINLLASHEDQVIQPPPGAAILAHSEFCSYAMLSYGKNALSIQPHPEFTPAGERDIIGSWQQRSPAPTEVFETAVKSLDTITPDSQQLAPVLWNFLTQQSLPL
jgi:GMP synthase-like glutamine amidotransferase